MENKKNSNVPAKTDIVNSVLNRVNQFEKLGQITLPKDYSAENALKSAYLILQEATDKNNKPVLESCSKESIANSLLDMVVQGLSPMKKQCAFVAYGGKLTLVREYHGTIAMAKRFGKVKDVAGNVIYEKDTFNYSIDSKTGRKVVEKHEQSLDNIDINKIKGAYATLILEDDSTYTEVMTITQIRTAWQQGYAKGGSPAHKNFTDQMAIKTVINRACKLFISSSDDGAIMDDTDTKPDPQETSVNEEIKEKANRDSLDIEDAQEEREEPVTQEPKQQPEQDQPDQEPEQERQPEQSTIGPEF